MSRRRYDPFANSEFAEDYVAPKPEPVVEPVAVGVDDSTEPTASTPPPAPETDPKKLAWLSAMTDALVAKGIARADIHAWVNVFTFNGWLKRRRCVKMGEKSVKYGGISVFHVSQTKPLGESRSGNPPPARAPRPRVSKEDMEQAMRVFKKLFDK